jgi:hypothetical protein
MLVRLGQIGALIVVGAARNAFQQGDRAPSLFGRDRRRLAVMQRLVEFD